MKILPSKQIPVWPGDLRHGELGAEEVVLLLLLFFPVAGLVLPLGDQTSFSGQQVFILITCASLTPSPHHRPPPPTRQSNLYLSLAPSLSLRRR